MNQMGFKIVSLTLSRAKSLSLPLASDRHHGSSRTAVGGSHGRGKGRGLVRNASAVRSEPGGGAGSEVGAVHSSGNGPRLEVLVEGSRLTAQRTTTRIETRLVANMAGTME